jgi:hypothetical protein
LIVAGFHTVEGIPLKLFSLIWIALPAYLFISLSSPAFSQRPAADLQIGKFSLDIY